MPDLTGYLATDVAGYPFPPPLGLRPRVNEALEGLALALESTTVPVFATESDRNAEYTAMIAAGKVGMACFVVSRAGVCRYLGAAAGWVWEPQERLLVDAFEPSERGMGGTVDPQNLLLTGPFTLPGTTGNRRLRVVAAAYVTTGAAAASPRLQPWDLPISEPSARSQKYCPANSAITLERTWYCAQASGSTIYPKLRGVSATAAAFSFWNCHLQVFDLGPA